jgi:hypothetical protein
MQRSGENQGVRPPTRETFEGTQVKNPTIRATLSLSTPTTLTKASASAAMTSGLHATAPR